MLGLAVGDALGTTNEFKTVQAPPFPSLATGPLVETVGGGPFSVQRGQVTDDTHMAVCVADSIAERGGFDVDDVARRYVAWLDYAFDVGAQTSAALRLIAGGARPRDAGERVWVDRGQQAAGNGSLMRTAPIGVFLRDEHERRQASFADSAMTHFDPRCQLACAAFNAAIAAAVGGGASDEMLRAAHDEIGAGVESLSDGLAMYRRALNAAAAALRADLEHAQDSDPQLYGLEVHLDRQQGFVRVAFRLAFWHLLHTSDIESALIDTANRGGDADTNSAIVGALLGARDGEDAIPGRWRRAVLEALQTEETPLSTTYHPRHFMQAVAMWFVNRDDSR